MIFIDTCVKKSICSYIVFVSQNSISCHLHKLEKHKVIKKINNYMDKNTEKRASQAPAEVILQQYKKYTMYKCYKIILFLFNA